MNYTKKEDKLQIAKTIFNLPPKLNNYLYYSGSTKP